MKIQLLNGRNFVYSLHMSGRGHAKIFTISEPLTKPSIINENKNLWLQVANY